MRRQEAERAVAILERHGARLGITSPDVRSAPLRAGYRARLIVSADLEPTEAYRERQRAIPGHLQSEESGYEVAEWQTWESFAHWARWYGVPLTAEEESHGAGSA
jgi:hypothetical protein